MKFLQRFIFKPILRSNRRSLGIFFILFLAIAVPVTLSVVQQSQDLRQHASGYSINAVSVSVSPNPATIGSDNQIQINATADVAGIQFRRYIYLMDPYQPNPPQPGIGSNGMYNPSGNPVNTILVIDPDKTSNQTSIQTPQTAGVYYILVNAYAGDGTICAWDGTLYLPDGSKARCSNSAVVLHVNTGGGGGIYFRDLYCSRV